MMYKDFRDILFALNAEKAKYLIVGGYAVSVHTEPRATKDLDLWIKTDAENSDAVYRALIIYGAPLAGVIDGDIPVHVISREDLLKNKLESGRPRDLLDVEAIREAASTSKLLP
jgi:hypothetical protein